MQWNSLLNPASSPFVALRRDMERHLGRDVESTFAGMSVVEHEDRWTVAVDVPGLAEGDVNITVQDGEHLGVTFDLIPDHLSDRESDWAIQFSDDNFGFTREIGGPAFDFDQCFPGSHDNSGRGFRAGGFLLGHDLFLRVDVGVWHCDRPPDRIQVQRAPEPD